MAIDQFENSYADFGLRRSIRQMRHAIESRDKVDADMLELFDSIKVPEERIEKALGRPVESLDMLEIGPGQGMERARYFGVRNHVVALDRDIIPSGFNPELYWKMAKTNGIGRVAKTAGRHLMIGRSKQSAFARLVGPDARAPELTSGDIETEAIRERSYDVAMSWSVFEHLSDPRAALQNIVSALRPGGALYISVHIFTAHDGHHDIRAFTGDGDLLPLWGHLRVAHEHKISPSSFLNKWRLAAWRELFDDVVPGHTEYLDQYEVPDSLGPKLTGSLRKELADYTEDELLTVNAVYVWQKPLN